MNERNMLQVVGGCVYIHSLIHSLNSHLKFVLMNAIKLNFKLCVRKRENLNFVTVTEDDALLLRCMNIQIRMIFCVQLHMTLFDKKGQWQ